MNSKTQNPRTAKLSSGDREPGSELIVAIKQSARNLGQYIEKSDWEKARNEVELRHQLLEEISATLSRLDRGFPPDKSLAARRRIRWMLEDLQAENAQLMEKLSQRVSQLRDKIKEIRKGRKTLGLYKTPQQDRPRFLNRLG